MSIFRLFELLFFIAQYCVFSFQNLIKDIFLAYIAYKIKVGKTAIFRPKPQVNPFGKMSIFRLFELLVFIGYKGVFWMWNNVKDIFLAYIAQKKKSWKKGHFWTKTMGQPQMSIFRLFKHLVFIAQKGVFSFQNIVKHIFLAYISKKKLKVAKTAIFRPKLTMG